MFAVQRAKFYVVLSNLILLIFLGTHLGVQSAYSASLLFLGAGTNQDTVNFTDFNGADAAVYMFMQDELGHDVTAMQGDLATTGDGLNTDLIVISSTLNSGTVRGKFPNLQTPIFYWENALGRNQDGEFYLATGSPAIDGQNLTINFPDHPIAEGVALDGNSETQAYEAVQPFFPGEGPHADGAVVVATLASDSNQSGIIAIEQGDSVLPGSPFPGGGSPGKRVQFFLGDSSFNEISEDGKLLFENSLNWLLGPVVPFVLNGGGESYVQNFNEMGTNLRLPKGWTGENDQRVSRGAGSLGLVDGPLDSPAESVQGIVNVGGNGGRFSSPAPGRIGTWQDDLDGSGTTGAGDVIADAAVDRALGNARVADDEIGKVHFEIEISDKPLRAFVAEWDLEIWGGDPESIFRGDAGGGYTTDLKVGGNSYYSETISLKPEGLFDTEFDGAAGQHDSTLINGNEHALRGNSSGIVEVDIADGAIGNFIQWTFDADHSDTDGGWIQAVDNVLLRALAAGDAQADGDVDPADLIQLLAGGAFGQGNIDATWGQGDFDNDGDFDGTDILAVVQGLAGEFPKTYSHDPGNGVPDVLINPATGNITLDTNGTTIGSIVMDSAAGIFNGPNSPMWDAPGDFAADIDTQISMPISFTNPGYTGVDDLGDGIIGDLAPGFDILADLTIKYLDPNGDLLDAEAHVVPEPSSLLLLALGGLSVFAILRYRRQNNS